MATLPTASAMERCRSLGAEEHEHAVRDEDFLDHLLKVARVAL
jgi:hypothetical protein